MQCHLLTLTGSGPIDIPITQNLRIVSCVTNVFGYDHGHVHEKQILSLTCTITTAQLFFRETRSQSRSRSR